jgi:hypothetical protein
MASSRQHRTVVLLAHQDERLEQLVAEMRQREPEFNRNQLVRLVAEKMTVADIVALGKRS